MTQLQQMVCWGSCSQPLKWVESCVMFAVRMQCHVDGAHDYMDVRNMFLPGRDPIDRFQVCAALPDQAHESVMLCRRRFPEFA